MMNLAQFGGGGDTLSNVIWFVLFFVFIMFYPKLLITQTVLKLEKDVADLEQMAERARTYIIRALPNRKNPKVVKGVKNFMEFFAISPVDIDPYGVVKKLDHVIKQSDQRFTYFVKQIAPEFSEERQKDIKNALAGAITTHQIAKIVRHFLETVKKYKLFQLALILQMQIPLITRLAKASEKATEAFVNETPIGDSIGPLIVSNLIRGRPKVYEEDEFTVYKTRINGKNVWLSKASGPGASTGYPGKFLQKLIKRQRIDRIITIDAGLRLEGEKSGEVAEGVGVAIGGSGVDRYEIEEIAVRNNIPLDAIAIKVSDEEALMPMKKEILNSVPNAIEILNDTIKRGKRGENILVMGIGNTCGVGDSYKNVKSAETKIKDAIRKAEKEPEKKKLF